MEPDPNFRPHSQSVSRPPRLPHQSGGRAHQQQKTGGIRRSISNLFSSFLNLSNNESDQKPAMARSKGSQPALHNHYDDDDDSEDNDDVHRRNHPYRPSSFNANAGASEAGLVSRRSMVMSTQAHSGPIDQDYYIAHYEHSDVDEMYHHQLGGNTDVDDVTGADRKNKSSSKIFSVKGIVCFFPISFQFRYLKIQFVCCII